MIEFKEKQSAAIHFEFGDDFLWKFHLLRVANLGNENSDGSMRDLEMDW